MLFPYLGPGEVFDSNKKFRKSKISKSGIILSNSNPHLWLNFVGARNKKKCMQFYKAQIQVQNPECKPISPTRGFESFLKSEFFYIKKTERAFWCSG